jgi:hypothetical protein
MAAPALVQPKIDIELPAYWKERMLTELAKLVSSWIWTFLPTRRLPSMDVQLPRRAKLRSDSAEPKFE